jgi:hypothetical protein
MHMQGGQRRLINFRAYTEACRLRRARRSVAAAAPEPATDALARPFGTKLACRWTAPMLHRSRIEAL